MADALTEVREPARVTRGVRHNKNAERFRAADRDCESRDESLIASERVTSFGSDLEVHEGTDFRALEQRDERAADRRKVERRGKIPCHHLRDEVAVVMEEDGTDFTGERLCSLFGDVPGSLGDALRVILDQITYGLDELELVSEQLGGRDLLHLRDKVRCCR